MHLLLKQIEMFYSAIRVEEIERVASAASTTYNLEQITSLKAILDITTSPEHHQLHFEIASRLDTLSAKNEILQGAVDKSDRSITRLRSDMKALIKGAELTSAQDDADLNHEIGRLELILHNVRLSKLIEIHEKRQQNLRSSTMQAIKNAISSRNSHEIDSLIGLTLSQLEDNQPSNSQTLIVAAAPIKKAQVPAHTPFESPRKIMSTPRTALLPLQSAQSTLNRALLHTPLKVVSSSNANTPLKSTFRLDSPAKMPLSPATVAKKLAPPKKLPLNLFESSFNQTHTANPSVTLPRLMEVQGCGPLRGSPLKRQARVNERRSMLPVIATTKLRTAHQARLLPSNTAVEYESKRPDPIDLDRIRRSSRLARK